MFLNVLKYVLYAVIFNFFVINKLVFKDQLALEAAGPLEPLLKGRAFNDRQGDTPNRAPNGCISWQHEFKIWEELWCIPLARYHWCMSLLKIIQIMPSQFRQRVISTFHGEIERKYIHLSRVFLINSSFFFFPCGILVYEYRNFNKTVKMYIVGELKAKPRRWRRLIWIKKCLQSPSSLSP